MIDPPTVGSAHPTDCRLLIDAPASGVWNMAVDEALLVDAADNGVSTLRFYAWREPTLSLGYFQHLAERRRHPPSSECAVVRRQTGGGAILHDRELTYSVSLPADHPLARQAPRLYAAVHDAFIAALAPVLCAADPRWALLRREDDSSLAATDEPFLCFLRRARGDVLLTRRGAAGTHEPVTEDASPADWKILGSAQRRHRGAVLQHGSLLLERSPAAPELSGVRDLSGCELDSKRLVAMLSVRLATDFGLPFSLSELPDEVKSNAERIANNKYGGDGWLNRR